MATAQNTVTVYDIVGKVGKQTFQAKQIPFSTERLRKFDGYADISACQYLSYLGALVTEYEAKGMTERSELLVELKRETYFIAIGLDDTRCGPSIRHEVFGIAAEYSAKNPGTSAVGCMSWAIGFLEGREEADAATFADLPNDLLNVATRGPGGDGQMKHRMKIELARREAEAKKAGRPFVIHGPGSAVAAKIEREFHQQEPLKMSTATAPTVITPPQRDRAACQAQAEREWDSGSIDQSAWISRAAYVSLRRGELMGLVNVSRPPGDEPASAGARRNTAPAPTAKPSAAKPAGQVSAPATRMGAPMDRSDAEKQAKAEWAANTGGCRSSFVNERAFIGFRVAELRGAIGSLGRKAD